LHFVTEPIVDGPDGALLEALTEAIADRFSHNLSAEVRKGLAAKRKRGDPHGTAPYGYRWAKPEELPRDRLTQLLPDEQEAPVVRMLLDWFEAGESYHGMVRRLNDMGRRTRAGGPWAYHSNIQRMLTNPIYAGYLTAESKSYRPQVAKRGQVRRARRLATRTQRQVGAADRPRPLGADSRAGRGAVPQGGAGGALPVLGHRGVSFPRVQGASDRRHQSQAAGKAILPVCMQRRTPAAQVHDVASRSSGGAYPGGPGRRRGPSDRPSSGLRPFPAAARRSKPSSSRRASSRSSSRPSAPRTHTRMGITTLRK